MLGSDRFSFETPNVIDPGDLPPGVPDRSAEATSSSLLTRKVGGPTDATTSPHSNINHNKSGSISLNSLTLSTTRSSDRSDEDANYEHRHRLLNDIGDLDLSPRVEPYNYPSMLPRPYDPYHNSGDDDDEDEDGEEENEDEDSGESGRDGRDIHESTHSLPAPEEARMHAMCLLADRDVRQASSSSSKLGSEERVCSRRNRSPRKSRHHRYRAFGECDPINFILRYCNWKVIVVAGLVILLTIILAITFGSSASSYPSETSASIPVNVAARTSDIVDFVTTNLITSTHDLEDPNSPQSLAVHWMAALDPVQVDVPEFLHSNQRFVQRYVAAILYYALNGMNWTESCNWMTAVDECAWFMALNEPILVEEEAAVGITCHPTTFTIQGIYMPANGLKGTFPKEIQFLSDLQLLSVPFNEIAAPLSFSLSALTRLNYLDLRYNNLEDELPEWIGDLPMLEVLGLSNNQFSGPVPPALGTLAKLKSLSLNDNALTGPVTFLDHLEALHYLWINNNMFTGILDDDFLSHHDVLTHVDLSNNTLSCPEAVLPAHLLRHSSLQVLILDDNDLNASFPSLQDANYDLQRLSLRSTQLKGSIPTSITMLSGLLHLDFFKNSLTGTVPYQLGSMGKLKYLQLGYNAFQPTQDFLPYVSSLVNLEALGLSSIQLGGELPNWLGTNLPNLTLIDVSHNNLKNTIPDTVWGLANLSYLVLHDNQFSGTIPQDMRMSYDLSVVSLYENQLSGDANVFCDNTVPNLVATDCSITCDATCCTSECCSTDGNGGNGDALNKTCYDDKVSNFLAWYTEHSEFNYIQADRAFNPAILG